MLVCSSHWISLHCLPSLLLAIGCHSHVVVPFAFQQFLIFHLSTCSSLATAFLAPWNFLYMYISLHSVRCLFSRFLSRFSNFSVRYPPPSRVGLYRRLHSSLLGPSFLSRCGRTDICTPSNHPLPSWLYSPIYLRSQPLCLYSLGLPLPHITRISWPGNGHVVLALSRVRCSTKAKCCLIVRGCPLTVFSVGHMYSRLPVLLQCWCTAALFHFVRTKCRVVTRHTSFHSALVKSVCGHCRSPSVSSFNLLFSLTPSLCTNRDTGPKLYHITNSTSALLKHYFKVCWGYQTWCSRIHCVLADGRRGLGKKFCSMTFQNTQSSDRGLW